MLQAKINLYENMSESIDIVSKPKKGAKICKPVVPKNVRVHNGGISSFQKALREFTEIKRPQGKLYRKPAELEPVVSHSTPNTVPRRNRKDKNQNDTHYKGIVRRFSHGTHRQCQKSQDMSSYNKAAEDIDHYTEVEQQVEEFGEKLRNKIRSIQERNDHLNSIAKGETSSDEENSSLSQENSREIEISLQTITETVNKLSHMDDEFPVAPIISDDDHDVDDEFAISDENFGLNEFSENAEDNFIVEAYNQEDNELVIVAFEIKRRTMKISSSGEKSFEDLQDDDYNILLCENTETHEIEVLQDDENEIQSNLDHHFSNDIPPIGDRQSPDSGMCSKGTSMYSEISDENISEITGDDNIEHENEKDDDPEEIVQNFEDNHGNVRISRTVSNHNLCQSDLMDVHKSKLSYIVDEFIQTEKQYIAGLRKVVLEYKPFVEEHCPPNLLGRTAYLFGNIEQIYRESKGFFELLNKKPDAEGIANAIIISVSMFDHHPKYFQNKPTSDKYIKEFEHIIKEKQNILCDKLDLASYLLTPIQRLGKYILMLESIKKELNKIDKSTTNITIALEIIKRAMKKGNDSIVIDSITGCPVNLEMQGSFILREEFTITKPRKFESMVFLFENIVIFTENSPKIHEKFVYIESIMMNDLSIANIESDPLVFHLSNFPRNKRLGGDKYTFVLEAKNNKIKKQWTNSIENILWSQLKRVKTLQQSGGQSKRNSKVELGKKKNRKVDHKKTISLMRGTSVFYDDNLQY